MINRSHYLDAVIEIRFGDITWVSSPTLSTSDKSGLPPATLLEDAVVITASNPMGESWTDVVNKSANKRLEVVLTDVGYSALPCIGRDTTGLHFEESFWAPFSSQVELQELIDLSQMFNQDAIFIYSDSHRILHENMNGSRTLQQVFWTTL